MSLQARAVPSRISASPMSWLSSVMRIALQRPSSAIISAVTPGSANQPPRVCAVSGVSSHGQLSIIVEGESSSTSATSDCPAPTTNSAVRTCRGSGGSPGSGTPGSVARLRHQASGTSTGVVTYRPTQIQNATCWVSKRSRWLNVPIAMKSVNAVTGRKPTCTRCQRVSSATRTKK